MKIFITMLLFISVITKAERCLVCMIGNARGTELAWQSCKNNLLEPLNADLALCFGKEANHKNSLYKNAKYLWEVPEHADWSVVYNEFNNKLGINTNWQTLVEAATIDNPLWGGIIYNGQLIKGSGAIMLAFRSILKSFILENNLLEKYDRFILTRSDYYYEAKHPSLKSLDPNFIWVPEGEDNGGISDRHAVISKNHVADFLSTIEALLLTPEYYQPLLNKYVNLERFLKMFYEKQSLLNKIKRYPGTAYTIKSVSDKTRWMGNRLYLQDLSRKARTPIFAKYPDEYNLVKSNLKK